MLAFTPRRQSKREFYYEWPIQIRLDGTYHNLALFFDKVSRFARIMNIEDLRLTSARDGGQRYTINAGFTMKTYLYIEQESGEDDI